jgi:hypothetical protein
MFMIMVVWMWMIVMVMIMWVIVVLGMTVFFLPMGMFLVVFRRMMNCELIVSASASIAHIL